MSFSFIFGLAGFVLLVVALYGYFQKDGSDTPAVNQPLRRPRRGRRPKEDLLDMLFGLVFDLLRLLFSWLRGLAKKPGSPAVTKEALSSAEYAATEETNSTSKQVAGVDVAWDELLGQPATTTKNRPAEWSLDLLQTIEWKRFEDLCAAYARAIGYRAETTALGPDGGVDVNLYKGPETIPSAIMQCKAWSRSVGVAQVRELLGSMVHVGVEKGVFLTTSHFTDEAIAFAEGKNIRLMSGREFLWWLGTLPAEESRLLLDLATEGDYATPTCPSCGDKMVLRGSNDNRFWGCQRYPRCRGKLGYRLNMA